MTPKPRRSKGSRLLTARKWMMLAAVVSGTSFQLSNCANEAQLFGVRTAFSTFFLPINQGIVLLFDVLATTIGQTVNQLVSQITGGS